LWLIREATDRPTYRTGTWYSGEPEDYWDVASGYPVTSQTEFEHQVAAARTAMVEGAFAAVWAEGMAMTLEQALTEVLVKPDTL
jgi:hypothetical protein